jgi:hypothetical protein
VRQIVWAELSDFLQIPCSFTRVVHPRRFLNIGVFNVGYAHIR